MRYFSISFPTIAVDEMKGYFKVTDDDITTHGKVSTMDVRVGYGESVFDEAKHLSFHYPNMPFDIKSEPNEAGWGKEEEPTEYYHRNGNIIAIKQSDKIVLIQELRTMSYVDIAKRIQNYDKKMAFPSLLMAIEAMGKLKIVGC